MISQIHLQARDGLQDRTDQRETLDGAASRHVVEFCVVGILLPSTVNLIRYPHCFLRSAARSKEHGEFNAEKKYGKFKQPSLISKVVTGVANTAQNVSTTPAKKGKSVSEKIKDMTDALEQI